MQKLLTGNMYLVSNKISSFDIDKVEIGKKNIYNNKY